MGIALSAALVAGIAPATAIAAETSSPTGAVALQTEDAAAAKDAASPEKLAEIDDDIAAFQELYDMVVAEAAKWRKPLPAMQANSSNGKQTNTTADKLANTGDTAPSAIALAGIAAMGLGITATATRRIKNSK